MSNRRAIRIFFIALLVFIFFAIRNSLHSRTYQQMQVCLVNMKAIEGVKEQYAIEHSGQAPESLDVLIPAYIDQLPECPSAGKYTLGDLQVMATCDVEGHVLPGE